MSEEPSVVVDGTTCHLYHFTGKVISTKKDKETVISSRAGGTQANPTTHVSSTTVDHHEFFLANAEGKEKSFKVTDFDFPLREGQTLSMVWAIPDGSERGPYIHARNHSTDDVHQVHPNQIADRFKKPWWMVAAASVVLIFATMWLLSFLSMFMILVAFFYFRSRSRKAAKGLLDSPELARLDAELAKIEPLPA
jgi:hypothetical protein